MNDRDISPASFRDCSGFVLEKNGSIFRQINFSYRNHYDNLMASGLYRALVDAELLIPHIEVDAVDYCNGNIYKIIKPEIIPFISYPYEWSFSQLKQAALTTLKIQVMALSFGMTLKDASAYNIQFYKGKLLLIDTLSFEKYKDGTPWAPYRQFCQHFVAPLALMGYKDIRLSQLLRVYIDGIPLDLASSLLPIRSCFKFSLLAHIHLHAKSLKYFADKSLPSIHTKISRNSLLGMIANLEALIKSIKWNASATEWANYYENTNYSMDSFTHKKELVSRFLMDIKPKNVWDFGANTGVFSRLASDKKIQTISFDGDPAVVEKNYLESIEKGETNIIPLHLDLTNPSPGIGWENTERMSLFDRGPADAALALALLHHLAIGNNLPFGKIADFLRRVCKWLIIEFIPKHDLQVQKLLASRIDIFADYVQQKFEQDFSGFFDIQHQVPINGCERIMYLMRVKGEN